MDWRPLDALLPVRRARLVPDVLAGLTVAMIAVPSALGYARLAGMPVVTGLYTLLLPVLAFVVLGSSRHLVVGADSATAVILASGIGTLAAAGSPEYVRLAGTAALVVAALLVLARIVRLGFVASFLSRTVLVGFLTGVGIQVAASQLADMLDVSAGSGPTPSQLWHLLTHLGETNLVSLAVAAAVVVVLLAARLVSRRLPAMLVALGASIVAAHLLHLGDHGVALLGPVPAGLPRPALPSFAPADLAAVLPIALSMFVVIVAQSAATAKAYAAQAGVRDDTDADLLALGVGNLTAAFSGTFVVNGSPTKTQVGFGAGGRSQLASLVVVIITVVVCLVATGSLAALPLPALAAAVFVIGLELVDVRGIRAIRRVRSGEFAVAVITATAVVALGVRTGILVAIAVSVVDHLRHSYAPHNRVLVKSAQGHWSSLPVTANAQAAPGLAVYRFGSGLYFANVARFTADLATLRSGPPLRWLCLDAAAIGDIDYTAAEVLRDELTRLDAAGVRVVVSNATDRVHTQLAGYDLPVDRWYATSGQALEAYLDQPDPT